MDENENASGLPSAPEATPQPANTAPLEASEEATTEEVAPAGPSEVDPPEETVV